MDIIRIVLTRVHEVIADRLALPDQLADVLNIVDTEMRREYGGERHYISKTTEQELMQSAARNNAIRKAWGNNEPAELIARRHGISRRLVYMIARGDV